jgi:hypothetical protein
VHIRKTGLVIHSRVHRLHTRLAAFRPIYPQACPQGELAGTAGAPYGGRRAFTE